MSFKIKNHVWIKLVMAIAFLSFSKDVFGQELEFKMFFSSNYFWFTDDRINMTSFDLLSKEQANYGVSIGYSIRKKLRKNVYIVTDLFFINKRLKSRDPGDILFTFNYVGVVPKIEFELAKNIWISSGPVSYTHLTLPTICSV